MECKYCSNTFRNGFTLKTHQTKAKYCIKLQGKISENLGEYVCEFCDRHFTLKSSLEDHLHICKANNKYTRIYRNKCIDLEKNLEIAQEQLKEALRREQELRIDYAELAKVSASRPTTKNTVNNVNLSVFSKTDKDIKRIVDESYTKEYLLEGQKGVAKFTCSHIIQGEANKNPIYVITDKARGNGKYKVSENEVVTDTGLMGLTKKVHPSIKQRAIIIATEGDAFTDEELFKGYQEVFNMGDDNSVFKTELVRILDTN